VDQVSFASSIEDSRPIDRVEPSRQVDTSPTEDGGA
jgi:hypothetical protein